MSYHQTGPVPEKIKGANYPLDIREGQYQKETGSPKAYMVNDQKMPTITLEVKNSGKIGVASPVTVRPLREPMQDTFGPDQNFHTQYVQEGTVSHSEGAFNN